jgi:clan AA aspartic protease
MTGQVAGLTAFIELTFCLANGQNRSVEFVVDTGVEGALTLPLSLIHEYNLPIVQEIDAHLADDSRTSVGVYRATIILDGQEIEVAVLSLGSRPLLGTSMLEHKRLLIDFIEGGPVGVSPLG